MDGERTDARAHGAALGTKERGGNKIILTSASVCAYQIHNKRAQTHTTPETVETKTLSGNRRKKHQQLLEIKAISSFSSFNKYI